MGYRCSARSVALFTNIGQHRLLMFKQFLQMGTDLYQHRSTSGHTANIGQHRLPIFRRLVVCRIGTLAQMTLVSNVDKTPLVFRTVRGIGTDITSDYALKPVATSMTDVDRCRLSPGTDVNPPPNIVTDVGRDPQNI